MFGEVERVTAKTGCTSCTKRTISLEVSGFRRHEGGAVDRSGGRGAVAPRPGRPERPAPGGHRRLLDPPLPRRLRIHLHGRLPRLRRAPPPARRALRLVQGCAPPRPPAPPIPDLHPAADHLAHLIRSGLAGLASAFRRVAQGQPGSGQVFACLAAAALLGRVARDLPTLCYAVIVGALTLPALYQRLNVERYARLASLNLYRYELFYRSFSLTCYLSARDYLIELLKEP